jgi:D-lyxose ketol-isomerase
VISDACVDDARGQAKELIRKSGFPVTDAELTELRLDDFGLGRVLDEGFAYIDLLRTTRLRITLLVLLPGQTLPQHLHPAYRGEPGKEETLRVLYGATRIYVQGQASPAGIKVPSEKESFYTARREIALGSGQQYTILPGREHWFQGGAQGSVNICFQNRVDETRNVFFDPQSSGCPIGPEERSEEAGSDRRRKSEK